MVDVTNKYNKSRTDLESQLTNQKQQISRLQDKVKANIEAMLANETKARETQQQLDDSRTENEALNENLGQVNNRLVSDRV